MWVIVFMLPFFHRSFFRNLIEESSDLGDIFSGCLRAHLCCATAVPFFPFEV